MSMTTDPFADIAARMTELGAPMQSNLDRQTDAGGCEPDAPEPYVPTNLADAFHADGDKAAAAVLAFGEWMVDERQELAEFIEVIARQACGSGRIIAIPTRMASWLPKWRAELREKLEQAFTD